MQKLQSSRMQEETSRQTCSRAFKSLLSNINQKYSFLSPRARRPFLTNFIPYNAQRFPMLTGMLRQLLHRWRTDSQLLRLKHFIQKVWSTYNHSRVTERVRASGPLHKKAFPPFLHPYRYILRKRGLWRVTVWQTDGRCCAQQNIPLK